MPRRETIDFEFIESVPANLSDGRVYVSIRFATIIHKCCCGCETEIVTPLSPAGWSLTFNGETITLHPSIGNWGTRCKSHYWIRDNRVIWERQFSEEEIEAVRLEDQIAYEHHYTEKTTSTPLKTNKVSHNEKNLSGWWARVKSFFHNSG